MLRIWTTDTKIDILKFWDLNLAQLLAMQIYPSDIIFLAHSFLVKIVEWERYFISLPNNIYKNEFVSNP